jgi:DNA-binding MarR family transcriptional regulator
MYLQVGWFLSYDVPVSVAAEAVSDTATGGPAPGAVTAPTDVTAPTEVVPAADVVAAWREMTARHAAVCAALEHELGEHHALGVSDFEVLDRLTESPERKARAQDLAESVHLSQSALSRLVDRLVKGGLVERCACGMDRRGIYVVLTEEGGRRHGDAAVTHRAVLTRLLPGA